MSYMNVSFESKGDFKNILSWLSKASRGPTPSEVEYIGREGVRALANNTPRSTGETASGWEYEIYNRRQGSYEISWKNTAHPEAEVNVAKLIELGHGTGTGGYVPPQPYIKKSMSPVWKSSSDRLTKEMSR